MPGYIDTHCHLSLLPTRGLEPQTELAACVGAGFAGILDVATDLEGFQARADLAARWNGVWLSAGLYPSRAGREDVGSWLPGALQTLGEQLSHPRVCAVGELGFDRHWSYGTEETQRQLVEAQVAIADKFGMPLVLHNREADDDIRASFPDGPPAGGILHCFSGSREFAAWALDRGFHLGFGGNISFRRNSELRDIIAWAPLDRIVFETDAPWLSPEPYRGQPNRPLNTSLVYQRAAELRGIPTETLAERVAETVSTLLRIPMGERLSPAGAD